MDRYSKSPSAKGFFLKHWIIAHPISALGIAIFILVVLFLPLSIGYYSQSMNGERQTTIRQTVVGLPTSVPTPPIVSMPKAVFASYKNRSKEGELPQTVTVYTLKDHYTDADVISFGAKLGLTLFQPYGEDNVAMYTLDDVKNRGILQFDNRSGAFHYQSYGELFPKNFRLLQTPQYIAESMLTELSLLDETIDCDILYERVEFPGMTFVECHRDWKKLGLPLIDPLGILNLSEKEQLASVTLGKTNELSVTDGGIVKISSNGGFVGKARPNDFNTITVAIAPDGNVYSIESTMRQIVAQTLIKKEDLLTQEEILSSLRGNEPSLMLVVPSGAGIIDWDRVFPNNYAIAKEATITDLALVYPDKQMNIPLSSYVPHYLIRGVSQLDSGYVVKFAAMVPAQKQGQALSLGKTGVVAGVNDRLVTPGDNLQIGTFNPSTSPKQTRPTDTFPQEPTVTPNEAQNQEGEPPASCEDLGTTRYYSITFAVPGYGTLYLVYNGAHTFFYKATTAEDKSVTSVKDTFFKLVEDQYVINVAKYLAENPGSVSSLNTQGDVYNLYVDVNRNRKNSTISAPVVAGDRNGEGANLPRMQQVAMAVAAKILEAKQQNQLQTFAEKQNIFPDSTLTNFHWIFLFARDLNKIKNSDLNACYISGASPVVFFSAKKEMDIAVSLPNTVIYEDPFVNESTKLVLSPSGEVSTKNSFGRPYLYYEYDKAKMRWSQQKEGFVVVSDDLDAFVRSTLSQKLRLNKKETDGLVQEIHSAIKNEPSQKYVSFSLISGEEVNKKLPMVISPKPDVVRRVHVLLSYHSTKPSLQEQHITPLTRGEFTVIEFGAVFR